MFTRNAGFALILALAMGGCNRDRQEAAPATEQHQQLPDSAFSPEHRPAQPTPFSPQTKADSISIEGTMEPMTLTLVQPEQADLPFRTYVPPDMIFEPASSGEGDGYYFYTNFAGKRNENAYLLLYVFPAGTQEAEAIERVKAFTASRGAPPTAQFESFSFQQDGVRYNGGIELRKHGDRFYYVARQYPAEYADGFGPRAAKILQNWDWLI